MGAARVGKTLGNFRILECLGSGGSGMIWKAEDSSLGRVVALKALRAELATNPEMSQRFREEARTLARLSHANVASLYSLIEDDDGLFLVLEYVEGNTLAALLATSGPLPLDTAFALFHQVLDGVGHAHEAGVVHRDLKPANLMVDARGRLKVMDFGIARVTGAARTTHHGKLVGTPEYMSPEQVRGEDATIRSDVYSLGILLFEMVTGRPPFRAAASFELMRAQVEDAPPDPRSLRPELEPRVAAAILRALAKRPADRFAGVRELQDALLDAGAARRGRAVAAVWRELPAAGVASEAPTLTSLPRLGAETEAARGGAQPRGHAEPPAGPQQTEPLDAWKRAVDALDDDLGAVRTSRPVQPAARAQAHPTLVLEAAHDTEHLTLDGPIGSRENAAAEMQPGALAAPGRAALWVALSAVLLALAFGVVRLREAAKPSASSSVSPSPREAASAAPGAREAAPDPPAPAPPASSEASAAASPAASAAPRSAKPRRATRRDSAPRAAPAEPPAEPRPATPPADAGGWVIRR
jgi:serine/threonine-protein kinase